MGKSCLKPQGPEPNVFGLKHHLVDLYQVCSFYCRNVQYRPGDYAACTLEEGQ